MSTRFYAGPISSGMGRRWDDWHEPEAGPEVPPRRTRAPLGAVTPPAVAPASPPAARAPRIAPIAPPR
jgi:hypothetical protein